MKKIAMCLMVLCGLALCCTGALAADRLTGYSLVVNGERAALSASTGYVARSGGALMVPIEAVCRAMGLDYTKGSKNSLRIEGANGVRADVKPGVRAMRVNGKTVKLKAKSYLQPGKRLTVDVRALGRLGLSCKHYKKSAARKYGYVSGALVIAKAGSSTELPAIEPVDDTSALPAAAKAAAQSATQIVCVDYTGGSSATLTLYQKKGGTWSESFDTYAYVGSKGIGKTREGDKRTPTGTFALKRPFGILSDPGAKLGSYLKLNKNHYWGGQSGKYYNKLIDVSKVRYSPTSADEHLINYAGVYNYCMLIDYNPNGEDAKGSAIFLHCTGKNKYTAGCVAIPQSKMLTLMKTLSSGAKIVIY